MSERVFTRSGDIARAGRTLAGREAVEEAVRQGATVYPVPEERSDFASAGSVGALLRYRE